MNNSTVIRGTIHGKTIQLDQELGLPEGQTVQITVKVVPANHVPGEGLQKAFGGWSEDADELDAYLEWNRQQRKQGRPEIDP
jgi:hypothetical protein